VASYTISNLRATSTINAGSSLTLQAPKGTVFANNPGDFSIEDATTSASSGTVGAIASGGGTNNIAINVPKTIKAGDVFSITAADTLNPSASSNSYSLTVLGAVNGTSPTTTTTTTAGTTTTTVPPTTTVPKKNPQPKPVISALTGRARVHQGKVFLELQCRRGAACSGTLKLVDGRNSLGSTKYFVRSGHHWSFALKLDFKAGQLLGRAKHHTLTATQMVTVKRGRSVQRKVTIIG
jgi:hypothetical protein